MATILTISNHKGGVGKTTTVHNLADALARRKLRVLAIDLDPQANLSSVLLKDVHPSTIKDTVAELLMETATLDACVIADTNLSGVSLISAALRLSNVERKLQQDDYAPATKLSDHLARIGDHYDVVLIDTPPSLGILTANAMVASDYYIIPLDAGSRFGLEGTADFQDMAKRIRKINPRLKLAGVLLTRYDGRKMVCTEIENVVQTEFERVFKAHLSSATLIQKGEMAQQTVLQLDRQSKAAKEYVALANELIGICGLKDKARKETE